MPEETETTAPARRRAAPSENSGGGGAKILAIILAVVAAGLAFALYKSNSKADTRSEEDTKALGAFTNQVLELRTKLVLEHATLEVAHSNHLAALHRVTAELTTTSNRLVQTSLLLDRAREETRIAQAEIPAKAAALATLEAQYDDLQRQVVVIPGLQREVAEMKEQLQQAQFAHAALEESLGHARASQAELERKLEDPEFLRLQVRHADEAAELRRRTAANQRIDVTDPRVRLNLQPDGTVRPALTTASAPPKK